MTTRYIYVFVYNYIGGENINKKLRMATIGISVLLVLVISSIAVSIEQNDADNDGLISSVPDAKTNAVGVGVKMTSVTLNTDVNYCGGGGVQCTFGGHTTTPASSANHNPIRIGILVTKNGIGMSGLTANDFTFSNPFVPPGGAAAGICGSTDCGSNYFQDAGNGQYVLFIHPSVAGSNWKSGKYFGKLTVKKSLDTLVSWTIQ